MTKHLLLSALHWGAVACQSRTEGIKVICEAPTSCPDCMKVDPADRRRMLALHIEDNLSNSEAKLIFDNLGALTDSERSERLRAVAAEIGLTACPMADALEELAASP